MIFSVIYGFVVFLVVGNGHAVAYGVRRLVKAVSLKDYKRCFEKDIKKRGLKLRLRS